MAHLVLTPYPKELPDDLLTMTIDVLRGADFEPREAVHALHHVTGYGLGKYYSDEGRMAKVAGAVPMTAEQAAIALEGLRSGGLKAGVFPWQVVLPILFDLILKWLKK